MSNLHYLCLFGHSTVLCVFCFFFGLFVFVLCLVYLVLPVSLDCPFVIASSVYLLNTLFILFSDLI
jgi:hypothetical protein